ncbi:hypothetical protein D3C77_577710 [compost metagenome]
MSNKVMVTWRFSFIINFDNDYQYQCYRRIINMNRNEGEEKFLKIAYEMEQNYDNLYIFHSSYCRSVLNDFLGDILRCKGNDIRNGVDSRIPL